MLKTYKYRIYPTKEQASLIDRHIITSKMIYNIGLQIKKYSYQTHGKSTSLYNLINQVNDLRKHTPEFKILDSQSLQSPLLKLEQDFNMFFKMVRPFPTFKKENSIGTFTSPHGERIKIVGNKLVQPKFRKNGITIAYHRPIGGEIKSSTIIKSKVGKYYACILCVCESPSRESTHNSVGLDVGVINFISTSDGIATKNPHHYNKKLKRLSVLNKRASRKLNGSQNREKANQKIRVLHDKIYNQRKDFLQKLSSEIIKKYDTICIEDINIVGLTKNKKLSRHIKYSGWGSFKNMLTYKSEWNGNKVLKMSRFAPSSKICSNCGFSNKDLTLKDREWTCVCGVTHDRDINAAINIKNYCLKNSGEGISGEPVELPTMVGAVKQEK